MGTYLSALILVIGCLVNVTVAGIDTVVLVLVVWLSLSVVNDFFFERLLVDLTRPVESPPRTPLNNC